MHCVNVYYYLTFVVKIRFRFKIGAILKTRLGLELYLCLEYFFLLNE